MGVLWLFKKYMDEVYIVGMDGCLINGDGCIFEVFKVNYGMGGMLIGMKYMFLVIFNVLCEVFDDVLEFFF